MVHVLWIGLGVLALYLGGEALVKGAHRSALRLGLSSLTAGLLIVASSTSMPEMVASLVAQVWQNNGDIALGNVVGSNIVNVGLMLGIASCVKPFEISSVILRREVPLMMGILILFSLCLLPSFLSRFAGAFLLILFVFYTLFQVWVGRKEHRLESKEELKITSWGKDLGMLVSGAVALILGGFSLIQGAVGVAQALGMSDRVVGLTIVAIGTSFPELAASCVAAWRGVGDIAVGNIIGSNIFNACVIAGGVALIRPIDFSPALLQFDVPIMLGMSALLALLLVRRRLGRVGGVCLIALYAIYFILCLELKV